MFRSVAYRSLLAACVSCVALACLPLHAEPTSAKPATKASQGKHPLDPVLKQAEEALARFRKEVNDYSCTIIRRERIKGKLGEYTYLDAEIRNRKMQNGKLVTPLSAHLIFLKPASVKGREVVWVEGKNNGKMFVSEPLGLGAKFPIWLKPDGAMAMAECKYPIMDIGIENLLNKLIERGGKDRDRDRPEECEVTTIKGVKVEGRPCSMISIKHPVKRPEYDYELAEIFIDDELQYPIRYAAYNFANDEDKQPLEEEYTYRDLKLNVGLKDKDFDR